MRYLLVNHIAATRVGGELRWPAAWARELAAADRAARSAGVTLTLASPVVDRARRDAPTAGVSGLGHVPLPFYQSARSYLKTLDALDAALAEAIAAADVVQLDHGGHPVALGVVARPIARDAGRPIVWAIGGDALPSPRLAERATNVAKRAIARPIADRVGADLFAAIADADATLASNYCVAAELEKQHQIAAEVIEMADALDAELIAPAGQSSRHARLLDERRALRLVARGPHDHAAGTARFLEPLKRCLKLGANAELLVAGDGDELPELQRRAVSLGLSRRVRFVAADAEGDVLLTADPEIVAASLASGVPAILLDATIDGSPAVAATRETIADAMYDAAMRRGELAARMLRGVAWARPRTIESAYARRFARAAELLAASRRPTAAA